MSSLIILLLILSCILIVFEVFMPGFGFFGISGIVSFVIGMILTLMFIPGGLMFVLFEIVTLTSILYVFLYYAKKTGKFNKIILSDTSTNVIYNNYEELVTLSGKSLTPLKPFGKVVINNNTYEVSSVGEFISEGTDIIVKYIKDNKIYVEKK